MLQEQVLTWVTNTTSTAGDVTLIAAPGAGVRIVPVKVIVQNESATADTLILKDGSTAKMRMLAQNQGDGLVLDFSGGPYRWKLAANAALVINKAQAVATGYSVGYYLENV